MGLLEKGSEMIFKNEDEKLILELKGDGYNEKYTVSDTNGDSINETVRKILTIALEMLDEEEEEFTPHLYDEDLDCNYGVIGKKTNYVDAVGRELHIGDVVTIYLRGEALGERYVVNEGANGDFIMGLCWICNSETGEITDEGYKIVLYKRYTELTHGEEHGSLEARLHG